MLVDLRSDTVTKPTPAMLEAMMAAKVGDDVYGEDPSINELEARVASLLGKEAGLYTPSGTMANQIAINLHTTPGTSVIAEEDSHVFLYEAGAAAVMSGIQFDLIPFTENFSKKAIEKRIKQESIHYATTKLLVVENTHNRGCGRVLDQEQVTAIATVAREHQLKLHCDGARLWNAAAALGVSERSLVDPFDTISVCFSKGLGAPVGSVLVGPKADIERGRKVRKRWGGAMRQAGFLAAAGLYALDHNRSRLKDDHRRVKLLHDGLMDLKKSGITIDIELPNIYTNILYFTVQNLNGDQLSEALKKEGVLLNHTGLGRMRAVTHMEIDDLGIKHTLEALGRILRSSNSLNR